MFTDLGFTGTRQSLTPYQTGQIYAFLRFCRAIGFTRFHHGDCVGADAYGAWAAWELGYRVISHPPTNATLRAHAQAHERRPPKPYLIRNSDIVSEAHIGLIVPNSEIPDPLSGTWLTFNKFLDARAPYWVIAPGRSWSR